VEVRFGQSSGGVFDGLASQGGEVLQFFTVPGGTLEVIPSTANVFALRRTTGLYGAGLIEAIPDTALIQNAISELNNFPDQAGEVVMDTDPDVNVAHVGRFGWKCQHATLLSFAGDAYLNEMGVSSSLFPEELVANQANVAVTAADVKDQPNPLTVAVPGQPGLQLTDIQRFTNFMRFLGPPPAAAVTDHLTHGKQVFNTVGCAVCHTPSFPTQSSVSALNGQTVQVYSDFLLHDVGTGDGIVQGAADTANKLRTAPLMAVKGHPLMHDSASLTVRDAISRHTNQGAQSAQNFSNLSPADQQAVVDFVNSL
jgi:CxxC motif-containing protein (DUF1111 family)